MRTVPEGEAGGRRRRRRRSRSEGGRGGTEENHTTSKLTVGKNPSSLRIPAKKSHRKLNRATFDIISAPVRSRVGFVMLKVLLTILLVVIKVVIHTYNPPMRLKTQTDSKLVFVNC